MNTVVPQKLKLLANELPKPLYLVGGVCRDFLAGLPSARRDWDVCAPLPADAVRRAAEKVGLAVKAVYANTGTVKLDADGEDCEFTSFRTDRYVRGTHAPEEVCFTEDIFSDARRRDFKCNAVYYDISGGKFVDPLNGVEDIEKRRITTVVNAEKVFGEDGLRLMRLCRIAAQTGFTPTAECLAGARANCGLIADVAPERIWAELSALLHADLKYGVEGAQYEGLRLLKETGVLKEILPELALGDGLAQRSDYHAHDVLEHTLRCVGYAAPGIRLAALLHDVGKPYCKLNTGRYARHDEEGEIIAERICSRLRIPKRETARVCALVRWHMYDLSGETSLNKLRKFMVAHLDILDDLLLLKQADYSASKDDLSLAPCVKRWEGVLTDMKNSGVPLTLKQLAVRGEDIIGVGICPNEVGKTLNFLLGECVIGNVPNDRERLLFYALRRRGG